ncbi:MAG: hypothetical protein IH608_01395, partial [Proteobacteria bacterium]|nr:hypothetical protein [Pseudomonadota bacterium]
RLAGRGVVVEGLDAGTGEAAPRDEVMARRIQGALGSAGFDRIVVLVGNVHALKKIPWVSGAGDWPTEKLAGRLAAEGVPVVSVVQWFPEGCAVPWVPTYREAGSPEADAAVERLWGLLNTAPSSRGTRAAAADGAVEWACPSSGT